MDAIMKEKLQSVLERVKDPETNVAISELGLVERFRYYPEQKKLSVFLNPVRPGKVCCSIISSLLLSSTLKDLMNELRKEFPDLYLERTQ
jgi:metal-sulfur cluster biosynthetic enzyme